MNVPALKSYGEAVADLVERCKEHGDPPSVELVDDALDALSHDGLREAARVGLVRGASDVFHNKRTQRGSNTGYTKDGRNSQSHRDSLTLTLIAADGKLKELMEFTAEDCALLRLEARAQKIAWTKREKWFSRAGELIEKSRTAEKVGDLRKRDVAELRQLAEVAWS